VNRPISHETRLAACELRTPRWRARAVLIVFMFSAMTAACGNAPSKTGGDIGVTAIRATWTGDATTPGGDLMKNIASELESLSNQAIDVTLDELPDADSQVDQDASMIELVRSGGADIAVVRTAAMSTAGAPGFASLQAPFLIEEQATAERVADDPIADEMLATLDQLDLVGLAIAPGGLRHPFGWYSPLIGVDDYADAVINTRPGREVDMLFGALGARTDHSIGQQRTTAATDGTLSGVEVSLQLRFSVGPPLILTSNVVLYTKFDVVIVNRRFFDGLTTSQQTALHDATDAAIPETLASRATESDAFESWCAQTGNVAVAASAPDVDRLRSAVAPMIAELERDPFTKRAIERIRTIADGADAIELGACVGPSLVSVAIDAIGDQHVIDGVWRFEVTEQNLLDAGVPPSEVAKDVGVHTWVLHNGTMSEETSNSRCTGTYAINGSQFSWAFDEINCGGSFRGILERDGDMLRFKIDESTPDGPFFAGTFVGGFTRVGDVP
jgi:TRAP-type C4-dicarboxylate transport system substrate-binding protein